MKKILLTGVAVVGVMLASAGESKACGLLRSMFGGLCGSRSSHSSCQPAAAPCAGTPTHTTIYPASYSPTTLPTPVPVYYPAAPSCPNGQCPRQPAAPSGFRLQGNIGPISGGISIPGIRDLLGLHNAERAQRGLPALIEDPQLTAAAQAQADAQAASGRMYHASRLTGSAENVAAGQRSESEVTRDWMNSPGHRRNILDGSFTRMGIGRNGNYWAVQFGR